MGWQSGKYEFTAKVVSNGIVYAVSPVITVEDLTFGADYKSNGGEAWYYDGKSWITDNLEGVTMAFELFV